MWVKNASRGRIYLRIFEFWSYMTYRSCNCCSKSHFVPTWLHLLGVLINNLFIGSVASEVEDLMIK